MPVLTLFVIGLSLLSAYGVYPMMLGIYEEHVPLILNIVVPMIIGSIVLVLILGIRERLRTKEEEELKEVKFRFYRLHPHLIVIGSLRSWVWSAEARSKLATLVGIYQN